MAETDILDILEEVSKSVVNIDTCSFKKYLFYNKNSKKGSGFVIEKGLVITNAHLVKGQDDICVVDAKLILKEGEK